MKEDSRLLLNHYTIMEYKESLETKRMEFRARCDEKIWRNMLEKSVERIINVLFEGKYEPFLREPLLDENINALIETIENKLKKDEELLFSRTVEVEVALSWFGEILAEKSGPDYWRWERIYKLITENHILSQSWMQSLSIESIQKNKKAIAELPIYDHPLELVETWGYYQDKRYWPSFYEAINAEEEKASNVWAFIDNSLRLDNEFRLKPVLEFKSTLLYRYNKMIWLDWVSHLPFLHMRDAALERILNLDEIIELLKYSLKKNDDKLSALLVWKYIELMKRISVNLEQYASERWVTNEEERRNASKNKAELEIWNKQELNERIIKIADILLQTGEELGIRLAMFILQKISVRAGKKDRIYAVIREAFIEMLVKNKGIEVQSFLNKPLTEAALISATIFFHEKDSISNDETIYILWDAYLKLLKQDSFYWDIQLNEEQDDFLLLWLIAGVLSKIPGSESKLEEAVMSLNAKTEGWEFQTDSFYSLNQKVVHLFIIGAMAADWLYQNQEKDKAQCLFRYVFHQSNQRIRLLTNHDHDEFYPLITNVWARLILIYPEDYSKVARDAINDMDKLDHILLALTVLRQNVQRDETMKFDPQLIQLMKSKFEIKFPMMKVKFAHLPEKIQWYESFGWWRK